MGPKRNSPPQGGEFFIGWLCMRSYEYYESRKMFDETYSSDHITRGENDTNRYELGRIGEHYVVMNYPSAVTRDENRATKIATDMKSTFMSIRFILLVGVGSAAPCMTNDIRLGDVVFGLEVLPYKQGAVADSENGPYVRSGVAKQPPEELRGAITLLKTGDRSNIQLEEVTDHLSSPTDAAQRPSQDNLYLPDYPCRGEECDCGRPQLHDARLLMERNFRRHINHIMIHEGVVGSADQPMRSVTKRIELSQRDKIICFETGTAGVMDICPCLTIRGISDYADGHKIVDWKPYASLVAAICARKLLGRLQLPEVRELDLPSKPSQVARWMQGATHKAHSTASRLRRSDCKLRAAEQIVNALRERRYILADIIDLDLLKMDKDSLRKAMERDLGQNDTKVIYDRMKSLEVLQLDLIKGLDALERQLHKQTRRRPMLHHRESDDPREWKKLRDQLDVELALAGKLSERIHKCLSTTRRFLPPEAENGKSHDTHGVWQTIKTLLDGFNHSIKGIPTQLRRKWRVFRGSGPQSGQPMTSKDEETAHPKENSFELASHQNSPPASCTVPTDQTMGNEACNSSPPSQDIDNAPSLRSFTPRNNRSEIPLHDESLASRIQQPSPPNREPPPAPHSTRSFNTTGSSSIPRATLDIAELFSPDTRVSPGDRSTPSLYYAGSDLSDTFSHLFTARSSTSSLPHQIPIESSNSQPSPVPIQPKNSVYGRL